MYNYQVCKIKSYSKMKSWDQKLEHFKFTQLYCSSNYHLVQHIILLFVKLTSCDCIVLLHPNPVVGVLHFHSPANNTPSCGWICISICTIPISHLLRFRSHFRCYLLRLASHHPPMHPMYLCTPWKQSSMMHIPKTIWLLNISTDPHTFRARKCSPLSGEFPCPSELDDDELLILARSSMQCHVRCCAWIASELQQKYS